MGFSWDLANEQAETLKDEITVSAPEALQLVSKILRIPSSRGQYAKQMQHKVQHLNQMIDQQVLDTVKNLNLPDELSLSHRLQRLSDRVEEYKKNQLLKGRAIVGVGGSFSAGKSAFINSLFHTQMLPEDSTTTTAIPTYFMNGAEQQILAYTQNNQAVRLIEKEMKAFTHQFDHTYHIGFAPFIKNLFIVNQTDAVDQDFRQLAFLDTPGYSKPRDAVKGKREITDYEIAQSQLRTVDYLIWLVDSSNTLTASDLDFMESLQNPCPVLLVFTKADGKSSQILRDQMSYAKDMLQNKQIQLYGITCYSSTEHKEYIGKNVLSRFLWKAEKEAALKKDGKDEMNDILQEVNQYLEQCIQQQKKQRADLKESVTEAVDFLSVRSLVALIEQLDLQLDELKQSQKQLQNVGNLILAAMEQLEDSPY